MSLSKDHIFKGIEDKVVPALIEYGCTKDGAEKVLEIYGNHLLSNLKAQVNMPGVEAPSIEQLMKDTNNGKTIFSDPYFIELANEVRASNNGK